MSMENRGRVPKIYRILRTIKAVLLVFVLVICTNRLSQRRLSTAQDMSNSEYEGHIVSQYHLYRLNHLFNLKRQWLSKDPLLIDDFKESKTIEQELANLGNTKLTFNESLCFNDLKKRYSELSILEKSISRDSNKFFDQTRQKMNANLDYIMLNLDSIANAKFTKRKQLLKTKSKSLYTNKLLLNMEIAFLIVIGIIVQMVIFYPWKP